MRVNPRELPPRLNKNELPSAIVLSGEEPLLIEESARHIRRSAREKGFADRIPLNAEAGFDWSRLTGSSQTLSLFAERRLIELRLPTGKPGETGTRAFVDYCRDAGEDVCLLVIAGRLDARAKQAKWLRTLEGGGWLVEHRALNTAQFQSWFGQRLRERGLNLDTKTIDRMCHFLEGNLLAAAQEIDRIALFAEPNGQVAPEIVSQGLADHARFNAYAFTGACLNGEARKALRVLKVLRNEGIEPALVSWTLAKDLRTLVRIEQGLRNGDQKGRLFKTHNIWSTRAPLIDSALARLGECELQQLTRQMARCDRILKGRERGEIWQQFEVLALTMCDVHYASGDLNAFNATN
ncbi:MAG: DNA polymerase III subunit delta [Gammaproteobacteria bacterium]|nr:DNA polymerase III subunit delta [Gammaproteobacteria bacterium]